MTKTKLKSAINALAEQMRLHVVKVLEPQGFVVARLAFLDKPKEAFTSITIGENEIASLVDESVLLDFVKVRIVEAVNEAVKRNTDG